MQAQKANPTVLESAKLIASCLSLTEAQLDKFESRLEEKLQNIELSPEQQDKLVFDFVKRVSENSEIDLDENQTSAQKTITLDAIINVVEQQAIDLKAINDILVRKSDANHNHPDYVTQFELRQNKIETENVNSNLAKLTSIVSLLSKDIDDKVSYKDALKKRDLEKISSHLKHEIQSEIKVPRDGEKGDRGEDGKDGLNWEFKFNDDKRGVLMYKREDWAHWKYHTLVVRHTEYVGGGGIGGSGGGSEGSSSGGTAGPHTTTLPSDKITFDNSGTILSTENLHAVILEILGIIPDAASEIGYDNSGTTLSATDTQTAIDEIFALVEAGGGTDDQTATEVPFDPTGTTLISTTVQAAVVELLDNIAQINTRIDELDGNDIAFDPTGSSMSSTEIQSAILELLALIESGTGTDDQEAFEVPFDPSTSSLTSTDVQEVILELLDLIGTGGTGTDDQTAAEVPYDPSATTLVSTDVQDAIDEIFGLVEAGGGTDDQTAAEVPYDPSNSDWVSTEVQATLDEISDTIQTLSSGNVLAAPQYLLYSQDGVGAPTTLRNNVRRVIYKTLVGVDGNFTVDISDFGFVDIFDVDVKSALLPDDTRPMVERIVEAYVDTYDNTYVSGKAFATRNSTTLLGRQSRNLVDAPQGVEITIIVTGDKQ